MPQLPVVGQGFQTKVSTRKNFTADDRAAKKIGIIPNFLGFAVFDRLFRATSGAKSEFESELFGSSHLPRP